MNYKSLFSKHYRILHFLILLFLTGIVYYQAIGFNFLSNFDDPLLVTENNSIRDFSFNGLKHIFTQYVYGLYHPLTTLSFAADFKIYGLNAAGFHFTNIFIHFLNIILVYYIVILLFNPGKIFALAAALIFAVHPMHVEPVVWISGRKDLLFSFFYLAGLLLYIKFQNNNPLPKWIILFCLFSCSLLSKPSGATFPLMMMVIDYIKHNNPFSLRNLAKKIPFFILSGIFLIINLKARNSDQPIFLPTYDYNLADRIFLVCYSFSFYLGNFLFPVSIAPKHYYPLKIGTFLPFEYYIIPVFTIIAFWLFFHYCKDKRLIIAGLLFYGVSLLVNIKFSLAGNDIVSDRYSYIPYIGLSFLILAIPEKLKYLIVAYSFIILCGIGSFFYARNWNSGTKLWTYVIKKYPENYLPYNERGQAYYLDGNFEKAKIDLDKSVSIKENVPALLNRAILLTDRNNLTEAMHDIEKAMLLYPENDLAYYYRSKVYRKQGIDSMAINDLRKALQINPVNPSVKNDLGIFSAQNKNYKESLNWFISSLSDDPYYLDTYLNIIRLKLITKDYPEASRYAEKAYKLFPEKIEILRQLADSKRMEGRHKEALQYYQLLMVQDKNNEARYLFMMALVFSNQEETKTALKYFHKAFKINPENYTISGNLGSYYFKLNMIDSACYFWNLSYNKGNNDVLKAIKQYCK